MRKKEFLKVKEVAMGDASAILDLHLRRQAWGSVKA